MLDKIIYIERLESMLKRSREKRQIVTYYKCVRVSHLVIQYSAIIDQFNSDYIYLGKVLNCRTHNQNILHQDLNLGYNSNFPFH